MIYLICQLIVASQRSSVDACVTVGKLRSHHISYETMTSRKKFSAVDMTAKKYIHNDDLTRHMLYSGTISLPTSLHQRCLSRSSKRILLLRGGSSHNVITSSSPQNDQCKIHNHTTTYHGTHKTKIVVDDNSRIQSSLLTNPLLSS